MGVIAHHAMPQLTLCVHTCQPFKQVYCEPGETNQDKFDGYL